MRNVVLRDALPDLVRRYEASLEIVTGGAAVELQESGERDAWLWEFEEKEYPASTTLLVNPLPQFI